MTAAGPSAEANGGVAEADGVVTTFTGGVFIGSSIRSAEADAEGSDVVAYLSQSTWDNVPGG